jgi:hypothetical protein
MSWPIASKSCPILWHCWTICFLGIEKLLKPCKGSQYWRQNLKSGLPGYKTGVQLKCFWHLLCEIIDQLRNLHLLKQNSATWKQRLIDWTLWFYVKCTISKPHINWTPECFPSYAWTWIVVWAPSEASCSEHAVGQDALIVSRDVCSLAAIARIYLLSRSNKENIPNRIKL